MRNSEHAGAGLEILSGYPVPPEVEFFFGRSPAALLQLDLARLTPDMPEVAAGVFREVASNHWGVDLDYEPGYLPLVEELLMAVLEADEEESAPPLSDGLVAGLGCFLGETIRRNVRSPRRLAPARGVGGRTRYRDKGLRPRPRRKSQGLPRVRAARVHDFLRRIHPGTVGGEPEDGVARPPQVASSVAAAELADYVRGVDEDLVADGEDRDRTLPREPV